MGEPENLYLDLLIKTLSFSLWPEPPIPVDVYQYHRSWYKRAIIKYLSSFLRKYNLYLAQSLGHTEEEILEGRIWPGYADTMIGIKRLQNIRESIETILVENIEGDLVETGVWRGGACILMRGVLAVYGITDRLVYVADSFQGLPEPDIERYPLEKGERHHLQKVLVITRQEVEANFRKYGLLDKQVVFLEGWFSDTLPKAPIKKLALLRLDGDMYGSTMDALEALYPRLSAGGYCIIDDFALEGCKQAVIDYRKRHGITAPIETIDWTGRFWRKEEEE
jgi:hypothetical protein